MDKVDNLVVSLIFTRLIPTVKPRNYDELLHSERKTSAEIAFHDLMTWWVFSPPSCPPVDAPFFLFFSCVFLTSAHAPTNAGASS